MARGLAGDELDGALARDEIVVHNAADGEHGQAAVLDLRELKTAKPNKMSVLRFNTGGNLYEL